jgi:hypothetical protein
LLGVGNGNHDHVRAAHGLGGVKNFEALSGSNGTALGLRIETNNDFASALFKVQSVGVTLGAEAEDREGFSFEKKNLRSASLSVRILAGMVVWFFSVGLSVVWG